MAKTSGGNRTGVKSAGGGISFFRETEKAVQLQINYDLEIAPQGGYTSSMTKSKSGSANVWIPKSQIKNGELSNWIAKSKEREIGEMIAGRMGGGKAISSKVFFSDAKNRLVSIESVAKATPKPKTPKATKPKVTRAFPTRESIVAGLKRRGKSSKEAWSLVNSKYKTLQNSNSGKPITLKEIIDKF